MTAQQGKDQGVGSGVAECGVSGIVKGFSPVTTDSHAYSVHGLLGD